MDIFRQLRHRLDQVLELNVLLLIFAFPLAPGLFNILWDSLLILWILGKIVSPGAGRMRFPPTAASLALLVGAVLASSLLSAQIAVSMEKISYFIKGIGLLIVLYDFLSRDEGRFRRIMTYVTVSTSVVSLDALVQVALSRDIFGLPLSAGRATAFFPHPFYLALWSGIGILSVITVIAGTETRGGRLFSSVVLAVLGAAFLFSKTRAAWIAMTVTLIAILFTPAFRRYAAKGFVLFSCFMSGFFLFDSSLRMRAMSILQYEDPRLVIWQQSWTAISEQFTPLNWVLGRGPGVFKLEYPWFDVIREGSVFPHMIVIEILYASGIVGLIAFFIWLVHLALSTVRGMRSRPAGAQIVGMLPFLVLLMCFINESFFTRYFSFPFWFVTAAALSACRNPSSGVHGDG